ncbi:unnamed protein product, partial [Adineta ricciae]
MTTNHSRLNPSDCQTNPDQVKRLTNYIENGEDNQIFSYKNTNFNEIELEPIQTTENNIANLHVPFSTRSSAGVDNCQKD